ncbi:hypothetical protein [uncultured Castellaniella sp.]|uniref:hypothetical protein n=1 Tax=uncultured Castellaniella sp. TaxID=647907 RepID=UPI0026194B7F|nr:hypothetical protein [uncultured Castellaniella sp.]
MTTRSRIAYLTACSVAALGLATAAPVFAANTAGTPAPTTAQATAKHAPAHKAKAQHKAKKAHSSAKKHTMPKTGA